MAFDLTEYMRKRTEEKPEAARETAGRGGFSLSAYLNGGQEPQSPQRLEALARTEWNRRAMERDTRAREQALEDANRKLRVELMDRAMAAPRKGGAEAASPAERHRETQRATAPAEKPQAGKPTAGKPAATTAYRGPAWAQEMAERQRPATDPPRGSLVAEYEDRKRAERDATGYDPKKAAAAALKQGMNQFAMTGSTFLAGLEDIALMPFEWMAGQEIGEVSQNAPLNRWNKAIQEYDRSVREDNRENLEAGGKGAQILDEIGTATIAAAPQAIAAMLTGGTSLAAQTTSGLNMAAQSALSPGIVTTVNQAVRRMAGDPQYWMSFAQTVGPSYEQAVEDLREKNGGKLSPLDMTKATLYALGNGLAGAAVEVGGGIQVLPDELRRGKSAWRTLVDAAVDEGREEAVQGILERGLQGIYGKDNPLFSLTDPEAVLNPVTAGKEAALGGAVGLLLGGGQTAVQKGVEALASDRRVEIPPAGEIGLAGRETASGQVESADNRSLHHSLKQTANGRTYVDIDVDQELFDGLSTVEMQDLAKKVIKTRFKGKVIGAEYTAYVDKTGAEHFAYPASRRMDEGIKRDKMRTAPELDNIMAASSYRDNVPPDNGKHKEATGGLDKLDVMYRVGPRVYDAEITVKVTDRGRVFYDMTKIKDVTSREIGQIPGLGTAETTGDILDPTVTQPGGEVNRAEVSELDRAVETAREKALQSAYEAGKSNVPREKVELLDEAQERAYTAGRQAAILAEAGPGVVRDEYTASLDKKTVEELDTVSKALGVKVQFVDSVAGGEANAQIKDGAILMERGNPNPVRFLFGHEITHHLQEIAPAEYRRLREAAVAAMGDIENAAFARQAEYAEHKVDLSYGEAVDELTADYVGRMMEDSGYLEEFIQRHRQDRTLLERLRDAFRELGRKLTGRYRTLAGQVEQRLTAAMEAGVEATAEKTAAGEGSGRFSLRKAGGKNVVWIESSSLSNKELNNHKAVAAFIARHIGEVYTIIESGQKVYIGEDLPGEYTQSKYTSYLRQTDRAAARAKNKAVDGLGELIETATNRRWERTRHTQSKDAKYGMYRYDSTFAFPVKDAGGAARRVRAYDVELVIRNASDGKKYLYDIVSIKENTSAQIDLTAKEAGSAARKAATGGSVSMGSVSQNTAGRKGETKYSFGGEKARTADLDALARAAEMEQAGQDPEAIRQETGWHRGADGKWRFEIDDSGMEFRRDGDAQLMQEEGYRRLQELTDKWSKAFEGGQELSQEESEEMERLQEEYSDRVWEDKYLLRDYLRHDELFRAYPQLNLVNIAFDDLPSGVKGRFQKADNTIVLSRDLVGKAWEDTLIHEIQHAIQRMEGFSGGSSPAYWAALDAETGEVKRRLRQQRVKAFRALTREEQNQYTRYQELMRELEKLEDAEDGTPEAERYIRYEQESDRLYLELWDNPWFKRLVDLDRKLQGDSGEEYLRLYRNTAGEIEARDSARRRTWDEDRRRETAPDTGNEETVLAGESLYGEDYVGKTADGIEVYETSEEVRALPYKERMGRFMDIMRNQYAGRTAKFTGGAGQVYYARFDEVDLSKNIYGDKRSSQRGWKAKVNTGADGNIFELVENAQYRGDRTEVGKSTQAHRNVTGWEYFVKTVQIDGRVYDLLANVRKKPDGEYVYSIQLNENKEKAPAPPVAPAYGLQKETGYASEWVTADASEDSITRNKAESKGEREDSPAEIGGATFSLKLSGAVARETERIIREGRENKLSDSEIQEQIQSAVHTIYQGMVRDYGAMKPGEQPYREAQVPRRTEKDKKVSQTVRTILEARATPEEALPDIEKLTADGVFSYSPYSDKQAVADAEAEIGKQGWNKSVRTWFDQVRRGEVSKALTTQGWVLYNNAANRGDVELAMDILDAMVKHQRSAAQAVQATRILKKLSPETQLYGVQRSVDSLQEDLKARYGKKAPGLKIDRTLAEEYLQARTQGERDAILADIYRDIGRQMPSKFLDKWNAWRYLAMLGNPRTHVRNIVGNLGFAPVVSAKNMTATAIEAMVGRISGGGLQRTKAIPGGKLLKAAWEDFANVKDMVMEGGKYDDRAAANQHIREGQRVFKNKALEAARRGNSAALEAEDMIFSKVHYAAALASYCKANGITAEQIAAGKGLDKAREYAAREAQKATYRDANAFSQFVSGVGRLGSKDNPYSRGAAKLVEGVLPFRKTPANILVRGLEYSPLGLLNGIKEAMVDVRAGRKTGAEAIDSISAGMVGTALLGLGIYLASQGWVRGSGAGDDKEKEQDKLMGHQDYALELPDGKSVTLDWLAPEALPFFMGVNLWEATRGDFANAKLVDYLGAVAQVTEPLLEMSMLQSLNDMFSQVGNTLNAGVKGLPAAMSSAATSYLTQGLPTLLGQMERSGEDARMTTYIGKDDFLTDDIQRALGKASARVPGWDFHQIPYIDAWGRQESTGDLMKRTTGNFLNPAYTSDIQESDMERELLRLYRSTGESVFPRRVDKVLRYDNQEKYLSAEEYVKYATKTGQTAREVMERLVDSPAYRRMDDGKKAEAVTMVYQYADAVGKESVSSYKAKGKAAKVIEASRKLQIKPEHYIALYLEVKDVSSLKDKNGESIPNSPGLLIMDLLFKDKSLTDKQREGLYEMFDVGKTIRHYSPALVKNKLDAMRRKAG